MKRPQGSWRPLAERHLIGALSLPIPAPPAACSPAVRALMCAGFSAPDASHPDWSVPVVRLVRVGWLGRAHGVHGEITLDGASLEPRELCQIKTFTWRGRDGETRSLVMDAARAAHTRLLVTFQGVSDRDQASQLTLGELLVDPAELPDPGPESAYAFELIGLRVETIDGRALGILEDIWSTGAHPVYVVRGERELLIPATEEVLKEVNLSSKVIRVALPVGLEEL